MKNNSKKDTERCGGKRMIIEQSFFRLQAELSNLQISPTLERQNRSFYEWTLSGLFYYCLLREMESQGLSSTSARVLLQQTYPKQIKLRVSHKRELLIPIRFWCDLKVNLAGINECKEIN